MGMWRLDLMILEVFSNLHDFMINDSISPPPVHESKNFKTL